MRRWNVGRREKWNCHLSIIIIIISIILWRSWIRFACERVSARYNKIMKFLLAVIEPHSELCSSNYWQTKKRVYMSDHNPLHVIFHTWVTFLTELIMYLKKEIGHDGRRRNWELGHPMRNVMQFFSPLQRRKEKVQMHTQKKTLTSRRDDRDMFTKGKKNVGKLQACKSQRRYRWQIETCISIELTLFFLHQFSLFFSSFNCHISLTDECLSDFFVFMI